MDLKNYTAERGSAARLARAIGVSPVLIFQWAEKLRPIPEGRAPSIELHTNFLVSVETLCPSTKWHRVKHKAWPNGKPLIDKTPNEAKPVSALRRV